MMLLLLSVAAGLATPVVEQSPDKLTQQALWTYRSCVSSEAVRLDDRRESATVLADSGLVSCSEARSSMTKIIATTILMRTTSPPGTNAEKLSAMSAARGEMVELDKYVKGKAVLAVLEARAKK